MVVTKAACPAGQLVIAPLSQLCKSEETIKAAQATFEKRAKVVMPLSTFKNHSFYLQPWVDDKRAGAFWFVEPTVDMDQVNMRMVESQCTYTLSGGVEIQVVQGLNILAPEKTPQSADTLPKFRLPRKQAAVGQILEEPAGSADAQEESCHAEEIKWVQPPEDSQRLVARVPVLINSKDLKEGETLFFYEQEKTCDFRGCGPHQCLQDHEAH